MSTGLAKISGGNYPIDHNIGSAIASFVPPPSLLFCQYRSLTPGQKQWLDELDKQWQFIAYWLVSFRSRAVDTKQKPFTLLEVLDQRETALLYNTQLDLCAAVWEAIEIRNHYPTPYDWWRDCTIELQQAQVDYILASGGVKKTTLLKGEREDGLREFLRSLKEDSIPFTESPKNQHLYRLYKSAIKRKSPDNAVRQAWNQYLKQFNLWIRSIKSSDTKALRHLAGRLYYQEKQSIVLIQDASINRNFITESTRWI